MRAVITETQGFSVIEMQASSLAFWMPTLNLATRGLRTLRLEVAVMSRRGPHSLRLEIAVMSRRGLHALRLEIAVQLGRGLRPSRFGTALMLRRELHVCVLALHEWL